MLEQVKVTHTNTNTHTDVYTRTTSETRNHNELKRSRNVFVAVAALSLVGSSADLLFCLWKLMKRTMCQQLWFIFTHPPHPLLPSFKAEGGVTMVWFV